MSDSERAVKPGEAVYDEDGEQLGTVRGFGEDGFFVATREGVEGYSLSHERAPHTLGEAQLLWRCSECGELGQIAELPETCPSCGAPSEDIYYWTED